MDEERKRRNPITVVETDSLSREKWLNSRRQGIGGSDVAAILGVSPFRTARDIYYDKLGIEAVSDDDNWVALEMGNLLEDLVGRIFAKKTGLKIFRMKKMFRSPEHPFMLADVDFFVVMPDGSIAILEIKTTNYNAKDNWWCNGAETVPIYYELQGRHYMSVMDVDRVFFCCLYGNTEEEVIIRSITRDYSFEEEMIFLEQMFWEENVQKKTPPEYTETASLIMDSIKKHTGSADEAAPIVNFDFGMTSTLLRYLKVQEEKKKAEKTVKKLDDELQRYKAKLISEMGTSCTALCEHDGSTFTVTYNPVRKTGINKDNLEKLKLLHPEIYDEYVTVTEFRKFNVKVQAQSAA